MTVANKKFLSVGLVGLLILALTAGIVFYMNRGGTEAPPAATEDKNANPWHFYNLDLLEDDDTENDFNFGPDWHEDDWTAENYNADLRYRLWQDPALGSAVMSWVDANLGTRFMGFFYETCKEDWALAINMAKDQWINNPEQYYETLNGFLGFLDTADVRLGLEARKATDQMYMIKMPSGIPDVIVFETTQGDGPWLIYDFHIKGNTVSVAFRTVCGYQPGNVAEKMNITPQPKPTDPTPDTPKPTPDPTPHKPDPTPDNPTPTPDKPTPTPDKPTPTPDKPTPKDPSKSGDTGGNDNPGPGPDTNNGVEAQHGSEDTNPSNSGYMDSYEDYKDAIDDLNEANEKSKEQEQNNNAPSYTPPQSETAPVSNPDPYVDGGAPGVDVDNNANTGTGNGNIDTPTDVQTGGSGDSDDWNDGDWSGPPD